MALPAIPSLGGWVGPTGPVAPAPGEAALQTLLAAARLFSPAGQLPLVCSALCSPPLFLFLFLLL